jgi:hypothetical protein
MEIQGLTTMEQFFEREHEVWRAFESISGDYNEGD